MQNTDEASELPLVVVPKDDGTIITKSDRLAELEHKLDVAIEEHELARVAFKKLYARILREIHDDQLYKEAGYSSFATYGKERWGYSRGHLNRLIQFAKAIETSPNGDTPETEGEARKKRIAGKKSEEPPKERNRSLTRKATAIFRERFGLEHLLRGGGLTLLPVAIEFVNKVPVTKGETELTIGEEGFRLWEASLSDPPPEEQRDPELRSRVLNALCAAPLLIPKREATKLVDAAEGDTEEEILQSALRQHEQAKLPGQMPLKPTEEPAPEPKTEPSAPPEKKPAIVVDPALMKKATALAEDEDDWSLLNELIDASFGQWLDQWDFCVASEILRPTLRRALASDPECTAADVDMEFCYAGYQITFTPPIFPWGEKAPGPLI